MFNAPDAYDRSIARYSRELAPRFVALTGVAALPSGPVLDVGCGTGVLTAWLARQFGPEGVAGVDPSEAFVEACRARIPGADVRVGAGEALPFQDGTFRAALAQLVLGLAKDAPRVVAEMRRVVRPGGIVAACTFEARGLAITRTFFDEARKLDPAAPHDERLPFRRIPELEALWRGTSLRDVRTGEIRIEVDYDGFDDCFVPFAAGVGPPGAYFLSQPEERRRALREALFEALGRPAGGFTLPAHVLAVTGIV
ncbi:MAG TPA: methyltransferase domain-containing protein [Anaeromyxobacter sp.]